jgi:hypothetical protein
MKNLFSCFKDTWVSPGSEKDVFQAEHILEVIESNVVIKLHITSRDREGLFRIKDQGGGKLLLLIRDPRDTAASNMQEPSKKLRSFVNTSSGNAYVHDYSLVCDVIDELNPLLVRYEDLCSQPDEIQKRIARYFNLEIDHPFSRGNERYRSIEEDVHVGAMRGGYAKNPLRPIDTGSIGLWERDASRDYIEEFARLPEVASFIERFYN